MNTPLFRSFPIASAEQALAKAFEQDFLIGVRLGDSVLSGMDKVSGPLVDSQFNAFTGETCMIPEAVHPQENRFRFEAADRLMAFAKKRRATVIGHTLVWPRRGPYWFFHSPKDDATGEPALKRLRDHIETVVGRYKGQIPEWHVVHEATASVAVQYNRSGRYLVNVNEDYIAEAFKITNAIDPRARLIYSDNTIESFPKLRWIIGLVKRLQDKKAPVHGVGIQGHWDLTNPSLEVIDSAISEYAKLGLKVMITNLEISVLPPRSTGVPGRDNPTEKKALDPYTGGLPEEVAQQQAERYRAIFEVFRRHRDVVDRVTFSGVHDGHSWKNNIPLFYSSVEDESFFLPAPDAPDKLPPTGGFGFGSASTQRYTDYALLFDRQGKPKPAFNELIALGNKK